MMKSQRSDAEKDQLIDKGKRIGINNYYYYCYYYYYYYYY